MLYILIWFEFWLFIIAGEVQCEQPNNSLYTFTGNLIFQKQTLPLSPNQLLLRVCYAFPPLLCWKFCLCKFHDCSLTNQNSCSSKESVNFIWLFICTLFWRVLFDSVSLISSDVARSWLLNHVGVDLLKRCAFQGCSLRNTEYVVGVVVFTGHETKVCYYDMMGDVICQIFVLISSARFKCVMVIIHLCMMGSLHFDSIYIKHCLVIYYFDLATFQKGRITFNAHFF